MIQNDAELAVVHQQLALAHEALSALRRDVLPKNTRNYEVFSEGYIDQILALRAEIDQYLGLPSGPLTALSSPDHAALHRPADAIQAGCS
jgi:hypothetical protein